ncbi:MAG: DUF4258 domain-containing protein [Gammaproteobacteria bacterium]|nr:DUF4258 domain-containing protein [Gammaproteobacteria bacterium]
MEFRYSTHAVDRMIQRQISTVEVEEILINPDGLIRQSRDKVVAFKKIEGRSDNSLAVVAVERDGNIDVVTVMVNFEVRK